MYLWRLYAQMIGNTTVQIKMQQVPLLHNVRAG
jgi:hypothetical protein